jgi:hypothetical protein
LASNRARRQSSVLASGPGTVINATNVIFKAGMTHYGSKRMSVESGVILRRRGIFIDGKLSVGPWCLKHVDNLASSLDVLAQVIRAGRMGLSL